MHLFHYSRLWDDLDGEMRRLADVLGVEVADGRWAELREAATLDGMRARADAVVPEAHLGFWRSTSGFLRQGGRRDWADLVDDADVAHLRARTVALAGDEAAAWLLDT